VEVWGSGSGGGCRQGSDVGGPWGYTCMPPGLYSQRYKVVSIAAGQLTFAALTDTGDVYVLCSTVLPFFSCLCCLSLDLKRLPAFSDIA
jgi:hypothetical protein